MTDIEISDTQGDNLLTADSQPSSAQINSEREASGEPAINMLQKVQVSLVPANCRLLYFIEQNSLNTALIYLVLKIDIAVTININMIPNNFFFMYVEIL